MRNMISYSQLAQMKKGLYLIYNACSSIVDIPVLIKAVQLGHIAGATLNIYPHEPGANSAPFDNHVPFVTVADLQPDFAHEMVDMLSCRASTPTGSISCGACCGLHLPLW